VAFAMFGAITFLPLNLQIVHGASPTSSGLQLVPMMLFMLVTSVITGRLVTNTGKYRKFPIIGTAVLAVGLFLCQFIGQHTPYWETAIFMAILGVGFGSTMQILILAVQNAVPYQDMGIGTSMATFARSIGGSLGVAVFGTIFNSRLSVNLPKHLPAAALKQIGANVETNPAEVKHLPTLARVGLETAFSDSLHVVFLAGVPFAIAAFLLALRLREVALRSSTSPGQDAAGSQAMPVAAETAEHAVPTSS